MKILSYPKRIIPGHKLHYLLAELGIPHTNDISDSEITHVIHYDYKNENSVCQEVLGLRLPIINRDCLNVKKDYVDKIFSETFGYSLFLDPTTHRGCCVEKTTQQAVHAGRIIQCPTNPDIKTYYSKSGVPQKRTYQRLIDTRFEVDKIREFRIPIIGFDIPLIFVKELGVRSTFHPYPENYFHAYTANVRDWFSSEEIEGLITFAEKFKFEFGEVDVLRSNHDGNLYIVDVNNIPMGTVFSHLDNKDYAIRAMAKAFMEVL